MTITSNNSSVTTKTRRKAAQRAKDTNENIVVYRMKDDNCNNEYLETQTKFALAPENDKIVFVAIIDKDGQFVD